MIIKEEGVLKKEIQVLNGKGKPIQKKKAYKSIFFGIIWIYLFIRMVITDVDLFFINKYTTLNLELYIVLRLLLILLLTILVWIKIGNRRFWTNLGSFLLFPVYPGLFEVLKTLLWEVPSYLLKSKKVSLLYNYIEWYFDFFFNFKKKAFTTLIFMLSFILLFYLNSQLIIIPVLMFSFLQLLHLHKRFQETYEPIKIFQVHLHMPNPENDINLSKEKLKEQFEEIVEKNQKEDKVGLLGMERLLMISEFSDAFNAKMRDILDRKSYLKSFIWKAIYSLIISMVFFGGINYGLYKMNPSHFKIEFEPTYFEFFYYSFFTIIPDGTDIEPITKSAKLVRMGGVIVGIFINLIVLAVYLAVNSERYRENLEKIIRYTDVYSNEVKEHFKEKYGKEPSEGLKNLKAAGKALKSIDHIRNLFSLPKK